MGEKMLTLIFIRHAESEANARGELIGQDESPISSNGERQIKALTKELRHYKVDVVYTSPLERAVRTAQKIADWHKCPLHLQDALKEIHFGDFETLRFQEIQQRYLEEVEKMLQDGSSYTYPGGESLLDVYKRAALKLNEIRQVHPSGTVVICAHGGTIRSFLSHLIAKGPELHWHFKIDHASLTIVTIENDFPVIEVLNHTYFMKNMV